MAYTAVSVAECTQRSRDRHSAQCATLEASNVDREDAKAAPASLTNDQPQPLQEADGHDTGTAVLGEAILALEVR